MKIANMVENVLICCMKKSMVFSKKLQKSQASVFVLLGSSGQSLHRLAKYKEKVNNE